MEWFQVFRGHSVYRIGFYNVFKNLVVYFIWSTHTHVFSQPIGFLIFLNAYLRDNFVE